MRRVTFLVAAAAFFVPSISDAGFLLTFEDDQGNTATINDEVLSEDGATGAPGVISNFMFSFGDWSLTVTGSRSKDVIGSAASPSLLLTVESNYVDADDDGGWVTITAFDMDFGPSASPLHRSIMLTANSLATGMTASANGYLDLGNSSPFATGASNAFLASDLEVSTPGGRDAGGGSRLTDAGYSVALSVTLTGAAGKDGEAQVQASLQPDPVPEPASFLLFGTALPLFGGMGVARRQRRKGM